MGEAFRTIDKSELEDFDTECRAHGINPQEFQFKEHDIIETTLSNSLIATNGKITVTRNFISKTYPSGNATHWVADFAEDLRKGIFN